MLRNRQRGARRIPTRRRTRPSPTRARWSRPDESYWMECRCRSAGSRQTATPLHEALSGTSGSPGASATRRNCDDGVRHVDDPKGGEAGTLGLAVDPNTSRPLDLSLLSSPDPSRADRRPCTTGSVRFTDVGSVGTDMTVIFTTSDVTGGAPQQRPAVVWTGWQAVVTVGNGGKGEQPGSDEPERQSATDHSDGTFRQTIRFRTHDLRVRIPQHVWAGAASGTHNSTWTENSGDSHDGDHLIEPWGNTASVFEAWWRCPLYRPDLESARARSAAGITFYTGDQIPRTE